MGSKCNRQLIFIFSVLPNTSGICRLFSIFSTLSGVVLFLQVSCSTPSYLDQKAYGTFAVANVNQGLAQFAAEGNRAVAIDLGNAETFAQWSVAYRTLGTPELASVVLSHTDSDHRGGFSRLPDSIPFSGRVIVSPYEDTALIRHTAGVWEDRLVFHHICAGDTIGGLKNMHIQCLWPPDSLNIERPLDDTLRNRFSLCFRISFGETAALITSDIDTVAMKSLVQTYGTMLRSDILVVPHHGSKYCFEENFYGYTAPEVAIISCGETNAYGHPGDNIVDLLFQMKVSLKCTFATGDLFALSNGEYWVWQ